MTTVTFPYQAVFCTPPQSQRTPGPFTETEPQPSTPLRIVGAIIATAMCCGFVAPPPAATTAVSGAFGQDPSIAGISLVLGGNFGTALTRPAVAFQGGSGETFPDLIAKAPQAQAGSPCFVVPPKTTTFSSTGEFPDLVLLLRQPPASLPSFVFNPPVATWALGQSPEQFAKPTRPIGGNEYPPQFFTAVVTTTFSSFGEFQDLVQPLPRPQPTWASFVTPPAPIAYTVTSAVDSDIVVYVNFLYQSQFNIPRTPAAAAATPSALSFTPSPSAPPRPAPIPDVLGFTTTPPTTVVVTFTGFGEFQDLVALPLRVQAPWVGFVTPPVSVTFGASGEFPDLLPQLRVQPPWVGFVAPSVPTVFTATSGEFPDFLPPLPDVPQVQPGFSFLQIAYTPSALTFSQAVEQFKAPRPAALEPYSFVFNPPVATWSFGQPPEQFSKAHNPALDTQSGFAFLQIAYTPGPLTFSQAPDLFKAPRNNAVEFYSFVFNPPKATWAFGQSPERFTPSRSPSLDTQSGFSFLQIAYTPTALTFSQPPDQFAKSRSPSLDTQLGFSFLQIAYNPKIFGFSQSPHQFLPSRSPSLDTQSAFSLLQIAYTPGPLVFSQSPEQFGKPRPPALDTYGGELPQPIAFIVTTPGNFGFSQWPEQFLQPRKPGLDSYSFISTFTIAATPASLTFSQSPEQFRRPLVQSGEYTEFTALRIAYTPSALTFSQSPDLFKAPRPAALEPYSFVFNPPVATWPFGQSPHQLKQPLIQSGEYVEFAALRIAYTPGPLVFSQSADLFRGGKPLDTQSGFATPIVSVTFGASGEFPDLLPSAPRIVQPLGSFVTPPVVVFYTFGQSPDPVRPLRQPNAEFTSFAALRIAYTPSALTFTQSPEQFKPPRNPTLDTQLGFSFLQIAYTPTAFAFAQAPQPVRISTLAPWVGFVTAPVPVTFAATGEFPDLVQPPRAPIQPFAGFITGVLRTTPSALSFTQSPERVLSRRSPSLDTQSGYFFLPFTVTVTVSFEQQPAICQVLFVLSSGGQSPQPITSTATPSSFGFSPSPEQFARPRKPALDQYSFVSSFRTAATPTAFGFSQSPWQWLPPRKPGLDQYSFVTSFRAAVTPTAFQQPQSPEQFRKPRNPALDTTNYSFVSAFRTANTPTALDFASNDFFPRLKFVAVYTLNQGFVTPPQVIVVPSGAGKKPKVTGVYPDAPWDAKPSKPFRPVWDKPEIKTDAAPQAPAALPYPPTLPPKDLFEASQPVGARFQDLPNFDHLAPPDVPALAAQMREAQDHSDAITALQAFTEQTAAQEAASAQDMADAAAVLNALAEEIARQQTDDAQDMADAITVLTAFTTDHRED